MFKDPVCNMMVDEKKTKFVSEAGGKKIYLCSGACKAQFDANPKKYGGY
jgi:YHS domain-containing protein